MAVASGHCGMRCSGGRVTIRGDIPPPSLLKARQDSSEGGGAGGVGDVHERQRKYEGDLRVGKLCSKDARELRESR